MTLIEVGGGGGGLHKCPIFNLRGYVITITCEHLPVFADIIDNTFKNRGNKYRKTFSNGESWWDIGIGGKGGVKRKGTRFWEKKNETKIL